MDAKAKLEKQHQDLKHDVKSLLWCIVHQGEKVNSALKKVMETVYSEYPEDMLFDRKDTILKAMREGKSGI